MNIQQIVNSRKPFPFIGSVSHGTMRNEDLIPTFRDTLRVLCEFFHDAKEYRKVIAESKKAVRLSLVNEFVLLDNYWNSEEADWDNGRLFYLLDEFGKPNNLYFGAHEGDGSDYGFWESGEDEEEIA